MYKRPANKQERHEAVRARLERALNDLYHNATVIYPRDVPENRQDLFESWFNDAREFEIDYIADGGAYPGDYRETLSAKCNAGRYKSEAARRYYIRKKMASMRRERARCNRLDSRTAQTNARWENISDFGELHTYGRGGRTLAPSKLMNGGVYWGIKRNYFEGWTIAATVDAILILESFNRHVGQWCNSIPEQWAEYFAETLAEERLERKRARKAAKVRAAEKKAARRAQVAARDAFYTLANF